MLSKVQSRLVDDFNNKYSHSEAIVNVFANTFSEVLNAKLSLACH